MESIPSMNGHPSRDYGGYLTVHISYYRITRMCLLETLDGITLISHLFY